MKFYSGKGDAGSTTLFGSGKRITKTGKIFEALGALDELNSWLGVCRSLATDKAVTSALKMAQEKIFIIQASVGGANNNILDKRMLEELEKETDFYGKKIGIINKFTMPGGTAISAHLDFARTLARKAERRLVAVKSPINELAYMNRLSSLLFVLARYANKKSGAKENNPKYK